MARSGSTRLTAQHHGPLVLFLIGMRIRRPWRPDHWLQAFAAMPRMLAELSADPDSGMLGYRITLGSGGPLVVQYWKSSEELLAYASQPDAEHRPAWAAFNRIARKAPNSVGIWHETYVVDRAESIYVGMPPAGLAKATGARPLGQHSRAAERLRTAGGS